MKKRFIQLGNEYIAIHYATNTVYRCSNNNGQISAEIQTGEIFVTIAEFSPLNNDIDEALFASKFSGIVAKLHAETPYA